MVTGVSFWFLPFSILGDIKWVSFFCCPGITESATRGSDLPVYHRSWYTKYWGQLLEQKQYQSWHGFEKPLPHGIGPFSQTIHDNKPTAQRKENKV